METATESFEPLAASSKHFARRLLTIGENRLELLMVEVQEERERLLHAILLGLGVAVFGFLAGVALTVAIVVLLWKISPVAVLLVMTSLYAATAVFLYRRFTLMDDQSWAIGQLVIKTGHRLSGKEVLIPTKKVDRISYEESTVFVNLTGEAVEQSPAHHLVSDGAAD